MFPVAYPAYSLVVGKGVVEGEGGALKKLQTLPSKMVLPFCKAILDPKISDKQKQIYN